jgi:hypothetical protein
MHLVCELQSTFFTPNEHAPEPIYWLKDYFSLAENISVFNDYSNGYHQFLAQSLAMNAPLPLTALQRCWQGKATDNKAWGSLQLVNWQAGRDEMALQPEQDLQVTPLEHDAIERSMLALLREDGFALETHAQGAWHISGDDLALLHCADLSRAAGHPLREYVPRSKDKTQAKSAKKWLRIANELQMMLYQHPVNDARAASKQPALNAVWLSGCGVLPSPAPSKPEWTHLRIKQVFDLSAAIEAHSPTKLTLCSADKVITLEKASFMQRLFRPQLTMQTLLALL